VLDIHLLMVKNKKPIYFVYIGSSTIAFTSFVCLLAIHLLITRLHFWVILFTPFISYVVSYFIFRFFIVKFINEKLKVLYRAIQKEKTKPNEKFSIKINDDVFTAAEKATTKFAEESKKEILSLKEQEEFRKEFLGNLAHELKTPLFSIQGYILTLLEGGLEDENVNRMFLERASISVDRMVNLIEDLDQINKLEVRSLPMELTNFDIVKLVKEIFATLELKAKEKHIKLGFSKPYSSIVVNADQSRIAQVFTNLINNSIHYGNENGETIIRFHEMNDVLLIEVSDNGPGIDKKDLPRLFERFYRVEKSRARNEGGSGLGLAIVKHIIESHNHSIQVRSSIGIGCTFSFTLDLEKENKILTSKGIAIR
jgi:two-component system phosphate regulon sensor histidine kinase PhoR